MNTTTTPTTVNLAEWEETIALTLIAAWTLGLLAFVNVYGNHQLRKVNAETWHYVGRYATGAALYEQTTETGESIWRYKTADNTWSYPRAAAVRRRGRGMDLWSDAA